MTATKKTKSHISTYTEALVELKRRAEDSSTAILVLSDNTHLLSLLGVWEMVPFTTGSRPHISTDDPIDYVKTADLVKFVWEPVKWDVGAVQRMLGPNYATAQAMQMLISLGIGFPDNTLATTATVFRDFHAGLYVGKMKASTQKEQRTETPATAT